MFLEKEHLGPILEPEAFNLPTVHIPVHKKKIGIQQINHSLWHRSAEREVTFTVTKADARRSSVCFVTVQQELYIGAYVSSVVS